MRYLCIGPKVWGVADTPAEALRKARSVMGYTAQGFRKHPHYVLEFPADAIISVDTIWGGWSADRAPTGVILRNRIPLDHNLLGTAREIYAAPTVNPTPPAAEVA